METKFTPGPWAYNTSRDYDGGRPWIIWGPNGPGRGATAHVAPWCPPYPGHGDYEETKANARLIATAPELFDLIKELREYLISEKYESDRVYLCEKIDTLLTKATKEE